MTTPLSSARANDGARGTPEGGGFLRVLAKGERPAHIAFGHKHDMRQRIVTSDALSQSSAGQAGFSPHGPARGGRSPRDPDSQPIADERRHPSSVDLLPDPDDMLHRKPRAPHPESSQDTHTPVGSEQERPAFRGPRDSAPRWHRGSSQTSGFGSQTGSPSAAAGRSYPAKYQHAYRSRQVRARRSRYP